MTVMAEIALVCGVSPEELSLWVERRWVLPLADARGEFTFSEADQARVRLIAELKRDLAIDDEAIEIVLSLMDQVYDLRRRLKAVLAAMAELPEAQRSDVIRRLLREEDSRGQ